MSTKRNMAGPNKKNRTHKSKSVFTKGKRKQTRANIERISRRQITALLAVIVLGIIINSIALDWGLSGMVPWEPDSNEGITIVREMPRLFKKWTYKYPRGHFLLNSIFYYPMIKHWQKNPIMVTTADRRTARQILTLPRLALLAKITRIISVVMGIGIVIAVFLISVRLFESYLAGIMAALTITLMQLFVFFCQQGTLYIPYVCWFAWGFYWMIRVIYDGKWYQYILMALCFSFSICTYDAVGGYLAGTGLSFCLAMIVKGKAGGKTLRTATLSIFSKKILAAIVVFLFSYALIQGIIISPKAFADRMSIWIGGRGVAEFNKDFTGQLPLLWKASQRLYGSIGWPLLAVIVASFVYLGLKHRWKALFLISPLIAFYLIVVVNIRMFHSRYLLPAFVGFALIAGKGCNDWIKNNRLHILLRVIPLAMLYLLSLLYCIGLDLEMLSDTRVRTEQWFAKNVAPPSMIGAGLRNKVYAPRLHFQGYNLICPWRSSSRVIETSAESSLYPDYLIMTSERVGIDEDSENEFREKLFNGQLAYEQVARFNLQYLYPTRSIFGFAGWPIRKLSWLSPEMIVFKKTKLQSSSSISGS